MFPTSWSQLGVETIKRQRYVETMSNGNRPWVPPLAAAKRLARLAPERKPNRDYPVRPAEALEGLLGALTWGDYHPERRGMPGADAVTIDDISDGLVLTDFLHMMLRADERTLIEIAKDRGMTWAQLGKIFGQSGQATQQRYKRLGGAKSWPSPPPRREKQA